MADSLTPTFQIAISGPAGLTFPSFRSTDLGESGFKDIKLTNIRNKANISRKLVFSADGKTSVDDNTPLVYYMSLSIEGEAILQSLREGGAANSRPPAANPESKNVAETAANAALAKDIANPAKIPKPPAEEPAATKPGAEKPTNAALAKDIANPTKIPNPPAEEPAATKPGVHTFIIKVLDSSPGAVSTEVVALPDTSAMNKLLEQVSKAKFLDRGALPTFANTELAALKGNYAAATGGATHPEPAELKESQWDVVLKNTRAFHGYYVDMHKGILVKAPKPAFRLRPAPVPGIPAEGATSADSEKYNPSFPPFYIHDNSSVNVMEIDKRFQDTLVKEGFNSLAVGGSLGGPNAFPVSVSAAFEDEHSWANQKKTETNVDTLAVVYNFPQVVIELDPECLELTPECSIEAFGASNKAGVERFRRRYGTVFTTCFTLGGFLHSTRHVTKEEQSKLDQVKDQTRRSAGISITTPKASGSFGIAAANGTGEETGQAQLYQEARLTWDACGGNTLLASDPPAWINTVKDYRLWRLMDQRRVVDLFSLVKDINFSAYKNLITPSPISDVGKDPIKDEEFNSKIIALLTAAVLDPAGNALVTQIEDYYRQNKYDDKAANDQFANFMTENYPESWAGVIAPGIKYQGLTVSQRVYFGVFMAFKKVLKFN